MRWARLLAVAFTVALAQLTVGEFVGAVPAESAEPCQAAVATSDPPAQIARLSRAEYSRTLLDLFGSQVVERVPALPGLIASIPNDDTTAGFLNATWTLTADHVSGYLATANELSVQVVQNAELRQLVMPCARDLNKLAKKCVESFIDTFAARAFRRDLEASERKELLDFFDGKKKAIGGGPALEALILRILVSPRFTFKQGIESPKIAGGCKGGPIDESFKRASRMSYSLWGSMPDAALHASALRGALGSEAALDAELDRMWNDERARTWMRSFFRQWLRYDQKPVEGYSATFLDKDKDKLDRAHLHEDAIEELDRFIESTLWNSRGSFRDLLTSRMVVVRNASIRRIYGLPELRQSDVELVPATRSGLLTRVAILAQGYDDASVVKRGALIRRQLLCDTLHQPDPSLLPAGSTAAFAPDPTVSTRKRWEERTSPVVCQGCHRMINPLGFALQSYDGIGRYQKIERLLVPQSSPAVYVDHPINAQVAPYLASRTEPEVDGPLELSEAIAGSVKANVCFVKQLDTFVKGRPVAESDMPVIRELAHRMMKPGGSVKEVMLGLVKRHSLQN